MLCKNNLILAYDFQQMLVQSDTQIRKFLANKKQSLVDDSKTENVEYLEESYENEIMFDDPSEEVHIITEPQLVKKINECSICHKTFSRPSHLQRHSVVHTRKNHQNKRSQVSTDENRINKSQVEEHPERLVKNADDLNQSASVQEKVKKFICKLCQKGFITYYSLQKHSDLHVNGYLCKFCQKEFTLKSEMHAHISVEHKDDRKHECDHCAKSFGQKSTLKEHLRTHFPDDKPFLCPVCGQAFHLSSSLRHHVQRHSSEKKFDCTYCPAKFLTKGGLTSHLLSHTGEKRHICGTCNKAFAKSYSLKKHIRIHTGERKIKLNFLNVCT